MAKTSRRRFLGTLGTTFGLAGVGATAPLSSLLAASFKTDPFTLGIASGDPTSDGFVIWTRLLPDAPQTMTRPAEAYEVIYEIAETPAFTTIVQTGQATALSAAAHSLHVEVTGLKPQRDYFYRFIAGGARSATGRTRTLPRADADIERLRFAIAGCQRYEDGFFTAYRHLARENFDFVFHYGDYIYETVFAKDRKDRVVVRTMPLPFRRARTLEEYRALYAFYKTDPDLKAAHASAPFIPSFDDHEVANDWQGGADDPPPTAAMLARRAAAFQAWYEHMPLRSAQRPSGHQVQAYRQFRIGTLANMFVLDTRQYRSAWPCKEKWAVCAAATETPRSLLGPDQEACLFARLKTSDTAWNILAQQVLMMRNDRDPDPAVLEINMDKWDGAPAGRDRLFKVLAENNVPGVVTLTGDVHDNRAGDLKMDFNNPQSRTLGVEFVGTSISSGGDGSTGAKRMARMRRANSHLKYFNNRRGYVRHSVSRDRWQADFRVVNRVTTPDAPIKTAKSMVTERLRPGVVDTDG